METYFSNMRAVEGTKEKLVEDLMTLVHDAEELVKATGTGLADKSKAELTNALARLKSRCQHLQQTAISGARTADRVIRDHPYQSIGVAFGMGMVVGTLLNRD